MEKFYEQAPEEKIGRLIYSMIEYDTGDAKRIQHFLKVHELAAEIGRLEELDAHTQFLVESAAVVHDIGIHKAEEKYGSSAGHYQEIEGPGEARILLSELGWPGDDIARICYLVGHHHTYTGIEGTDLQILIEADFLVNIFEDEIPASERERVFEHIFKTSAGKKLFRLMYPADGSFSS